MRLLRDFFGLHRNHRNGEKRGGAGVLKLVSAGAHESDDGWFSRDVDGLDRKMPVCVNFPMKKLKEEFTQNAVFPSNVSRSARAPVFGVHLPQTCVVAI